MKWGLGGIPKRNLNTMAVSIEVTCKNSIN
jgi:hypothetical protein